MVDRQIQKKGTSGKTKGKAQTSTKQKTLIGMFAPKKVAPPSITELQPVSTLEPIAFVNGQMEVNGNKPPAVSNDVIDLVADEEADKATTSDMPPSPVCVLSETNEPLEISDIEELAQLTSHEQVDFNTTERQPKTLIVNSVGTSRSKPIIVDSSPIKSFNPRFSSAVTTVHPFFVPKCIFTKSQTPPTHMQSSKQLSVPFPDHVSQHVRGPQPPRKPSDYPHQTVRLKQSRVETNSNSGYAFLAPDLNSHQSDPVRRPASPPLASSTTLQDYVKTIPKEHITQYFAIARSVDQSVSESVPTAPCGNLWTDKWRPRCAQEVLGNEASAIYLRNWLRALELQLDRVPPSPTPAHGSASRKGTHKSLPVSKGRKRPRIIRAVDRVRSRKRAKTESDEDDDWIVYSEDEDDDESHYSTDDLNAPMSPSPLPSLAGSAFESEILPTITAGINTTTQGLGELHNTILLCGPPGTGKTASVYACAEELGWEVFEVYPGIGKRNGANIDNLVGEVGKNHLVRQKPHGRHDFFTIASPTKRKGGTSGPSEQRNTPLEEIEHILSTDAGPNKDESRSLGQSLILLEEVDILFKEDSNFWQTVTRVIKECKRPVICTCNDLSLVPALDLPLQKILFFQSCPSDVAASYLQGLCCAEGRCVGRNDLLELYTKTQEDIDETTQAEVEVAGASAHDLRRAINMLQVSLTTGFPQSNRRSKPLEMEPCQQTDQVSSMDPSIEPLFTPNAAKTLTGDAAKILVDEAESASFLDCHLFRNQTDYPEAIEKESAVTSNDDEIGHTILYELKNDSSQLSAYCRDVEMRITVRDLLLGAHESAENSIVANFGEMGSLLRARTDFQNHAGHVLQDVCARIVSYMPQAHMYTDYLPWIRQIVAADDAQEEVTYQKMRERGGRQTRNSALRAYVRTLTLGDEGRLGLVRSVFRGESGGLEE